MKKQPNIKLVFLLSNWYSGATLFSILLNNQKNITCSGETFPFDSKDAGIYTCSCGASLLDCEFYNNACGHMLNKDRTNYNKYFAILPKITNSYIINKMFTNFLYFPNIRNFFFSNISQFRSEINKYIIAHETFMEKSCKFNNSNIFIDGTKSLRRAELFANFSKYKFKIIHLVRDGRGFCCSYMKHAELHNDKQIRASNSWLEYLKLLDIFSRRYPNIEIMTIRYEDICDDISSVFTKVFDFIGCDFITETFNSKITKEYHVLGNRMRKKFDGTIKEDLSWQDKFNSNDLNLITSIMENKLKKYRYI